VAAAQVLHEGMSGDNHDRGAVVAQMPQRTQPPLELAVVGFSAVVSVLLAVMPRRRNQFVEQPGLWR
jgi:hypothetical protein